MADDDITEGEAPPVMVSATRNRADLNDVMATLRTSMVTKVQTLLANLFKFQGITNPTISQR